MLRRRDLRPDAVLEALLQRGHDALEVVGPAARAVRLRRGPGGWGVQASSLDRTQQRTGVVKGFFGVFSDVQRRILRDHNLRICSSL